MSRYSNTMKMSERLMIISCSWTTASCFSSFRIEISRMVVEGTPSDSLEETYGQLFSVVLIDYYPRGH